MLFRVWSRVKKTKNKKSIQASLKLNKKKRNACPLYTKNSEYHQKDAASE